MRRFSERHGVIKARSVLQRGAIDLRLKNRLWSAADQVFWDNLVYYYYKEPTSKLIMTTTQDLFFGLATDALSATSSDNVALYKKIVFSYSWNEFYDFIQFLADFSQFQGDGSAASNLRRYGEKFIETVNLILAQEKAAYRFVASELCEITDENEIAEIELAVGISDQFDPARVHLSAALSLYANRDTPDYRNSIKEAISAVESLFSVFNNEKSRNMTTAVALAEKNGLKLHAALKEGILKFYGWTSDEGGVRHSLFEGQGDVGEAHARFMLVICSALFNFIRTA